MNFNNKKIAIAGFGVEGRATFEYLISKNISNITIVDNDKDLTDVPKASEVILGEDAFSKLKSFDVVFRSPQIAPYKIVTDGQIWSATNEFFAKCSGSIVAVTGTKGKGTTSSLIAEMLRNDGKTVHLLGNIGVPALSKLDSIESDDIVVFEISSFQLWDIKKGPHIAVVLMVEPDHLDVHSDIEEYIEAKSNIVKFQDSKDVVVRHPNNAMTSQVVMGAKSRKISYMSDVEDGSYVQNEHVMINDQPIIGTSDVGLLGEHNLENVCAAVTVAWQYTKNTDAIRKAVKEFKGLPHRLEFVKEVRAVKYYDDSQATGLTSSIAAIKAFKGKNKVIVLGGSDKGLDIEPLFKTLDSNDHLILVGQSTNAMSKLADKYSIKHWDFGTDINMQKIVQKCAEASSAGSVVLLSPAHASFDMFDSYIDRGEQFHEAVKNLPS